MFLARGLVCLMVVMLCLPVVIAEDDAQAADDTKPAVDTKQVDQTEPQKDEIKRSSKAARAKGEITFDDLKFEIEKDAPFKDEMITDDIKELDGKIVNLRGWILPATLFSETNIKAFVLVRDNKECCFGPGAAIFDCVMVEMVPGETIDYVTRPITVRGKLKIDTKRYKYPGGKAPRGNNSHLAVYRIEGESVK